MSYIQPRLDSRGFPIEFNRKSAISINSYILKDFLMNLIGNQLYLSKARFYWIWWEMSSGQPKPFSLWLNTEFDKKWAISVQVHILMDSLLNLMRNGSYPSKARFLRISYQNQLEMSYIHQYSILYVFLLNLMRNELRAAIALFSMISYWIW